jgi:hypothetical protein
MLTKVRMQEIIDTAKRNANVGPWSDQIKTPDVITKNEMEEVFQHWDRLDGDTCFMDAFYDLMNKVE